MELSDGDASIDMECWEEEEMWKDIPPMCSDDFDEFDISDACLVVVDGSKLKEEDEDEDEDEFMIVVEFWLMVRFKSCLAMFSHPGDPREGGCSSSEGQAVESSVTHRNIAQKAITDYNNLTKEGKLKLEKVVKSTLAFWGGENYFMTFSATNVDTGKTGLYQAALQESIDGYLLGLLRDFSTGRILAILSVTGESAEEKLALRREIIKEAKDFEAAKKEASEQSEELEDARKPARRVKLLKKQGKPVRREAKRVKILKKLGKRVRGETKPYPIFIEHSENDQQ